MRSIVDQEEGAIMKNDLVSYNDFVSMGLTLGPHFVKQRMRYGTFPKAIKGGRVVLNN